ncbi:cytosolic Fe-S cluster assembly factor nbp35 [Kluyveromyces marxianus]|nr:cytosolic Fe-S cluster assembly factor nbp35 [Kluyveromyces marxianus]KAG0683125.1 cytosolic Fe-S cluster assembly factor nbp35 [Kluyveromyces marxianus]
MAEVDQNSVTQQQVLPPDYSLKEPEPEHCPGPESENAGKGDSCQGCANKEICESLPKGPDPDLPLIRDNLANIKHKVLILSGKGGVGKSTFTTMLSWALSADEDLQVGAMDLDICGPSLPHMLGCRDENIHESNTGWTPVYVTDNLATMSIQYMLPDTDSAIIWRGSKKNALIKKFLKDSKIDGALIVTTPQEVALLDVRKEINFCKKAGINILGLVENMSGFVCPNCKGESQIFRATTGGGKALCKELNIPFLGSVPLDPRIGKCCETGESFLDEYPDSPASAAILEVIESLRDAVGDV